MDRRPLLPTSRESSRRPPPEPLLPPSQVDASLVVFEDDVDDASNGAGPASDARHSIFSSLSLSAWSEGGSTAAAPPSYLTACLLRPFQRLRFWCSEGERGRWCGSCACLSFLAASCCCCCRRRRASPSSASRGGGDGARDTDNDAFYAETGNAVAADALRASGVSRASQQSKGNETPTTTPHHGRSNSNRQHRQYAPPRSHVSGVNLMSLSPSLEAVGAAHENADGAQGDSVAESSLAGSSTPPSSIALGRVVATAPGEQLVMQRGVLMRMAPDGSCTRVEDAAATTTRSYDVGDNGTTGGAGQFLNQHYVPRTASLEEARGGVAQVCNSGGAEGGLSTDAEDAHNPYALSMAMHALETGRRPLHTLEQVSSALTTFAPYLPLRVEAEVDLNSASALPAEGVASPSSPTAPAVPLCLHVLGPVQSCPTAAALRILEDVLLEDCDQGRLCMNALHCADLDVRGVAPGSDDAAGPSPARTGRLGGAEEGRAGMQSNAFLDLLLSPVVADARSPAGTRNARSPVSSNSGALTVTTASTHVLAFLSAVVRGRGPQLTTMHFTRCFVAPHDMARFVPLPLGTLRRLRYEHCSLTPAHIDALLTVARYQDAERRSSARGSVGARDARSFSVLEELQLSGPLTVECVSELLDYVEEQQLQAVEGSGGAVSLHQLILPSALVRAAKEHPFVRANYQRISVVSAH